MRKGRTTSSAARFLGLPIMDNGLTVNVTDAAVANVWGDAEDRDYDQLTRELNDLLRLKAPIVAMKRFRTIEDCLAIEGLRRPSSDQRFTTDQLVGQARWFGKGLCVTAEDLAGRQCSAVVGLTPRDDAFLGGKEFEDVWYETQADCAAHQRAMACAPYGHYHALAVWQLERVKIGNPDICLIYATPGQMIILINALQWTKYEQMPFSCVGESSCADSWGRAMMTGKPSVSIPCFAERKFGGVLDEELLIALPPSYLPKIVGGLRALQANGIRYPIAHLGTRHPAGPVLDAIYGDGAE